MWIMLNFGSVENVVAGSQLVGCSLLLSYTIIIRPTHAAWPAGFAALVYHGFVPHICSTFAVFILRLGVLDYYSIGNMTDELSYYIMFVGTVLAELIAAFSQLLRMISCRSSCCLIVVSFRAKPTD